ncbi:hypothetical protein JXB02_00920 [Candidatus Woesearchaeota archaeon]|nr:hypothetical protein [Candidatus Woesearchaeota archaeon]
MERKGQISLEYMILIGVSMLVLVLFLVSIGSTYVDLSNEKERAKVTDLAYMIQNEINLAAQVRSGYERVFVLPADLDGINYTASLLPGAVSVASAGYEITLITSEANGTLAKGNNTIVQTDGTICINGC